MSNSNVKMRYALVNGKKQLPEAGLHGICPMCGAEVISKCGTVRNPHWAHKSISDCDSWSEGKTDWHIKWQDNFPVEWQEVTIRKEECIHRADVCISDDKGNPVTVIEFQHSYLEQEDLSAREAFYPGLIWVVDVSEKKRDQKRFEDHKYCMYKEDAMGHLLRANRLDILFPKTWLNCHAPVFFDFSGFSSEKEQLLYCLYPNIFDGGERYVGCYTKDEFIAASRSGTIFPRILEICNIISNHIKAKAEYIRFVKEKRMNQLFPGGGSWRPRRL